MNAERRKALAITVETLQTAKAAIETLKEEEQAAFDNLPESLQETEKGVKMEEAISSMDDAISEIETVIENLNNAQL